MKVLALTFFAQLVLAIAFLVSRTRASDRPPGFLDRVSSLLVSGIWLGAAIWLRHSTTWSFVGIGARLFVAFALVMVCSALLLMTGFIERLAGSPRPVND